MVCGADEVLATVDMLDITDAGHAVLVCRSPGSVAGAAFSSLQAVACYVLGMQAPEWHYATSPALEAMFLIEASPPRCDGHSAEVGRPWVSLLGHIRDRAIRFRRTDAGMKAAAAARPPVAPAMAPAAPKRTRRTETNRNASGLGTALRYAQVEEADGAERCHAPVMIGDNVGLALQGVDAEDPDPELEDVVAAVSHLVQSQRCAHVAARALAPVALATTCPADARDLMALDSARPGGARPLDCAQDTCSLRDWRALFELHHGIANASDARQLVLSLQGVLHGMGQAAVPPSQDGAARVRVYACGPADGCVRFPLHPHPWPLVARAADVAAWKWVQRWLRRVNQTPSLGRQREMLRSLCALAQTAWIAEAQTGRWTAPPECGKAPPLVPCSSAARNHNNADITGHKRKQRTG